MSKPWRMTWTLVSGMVAACAVSALDAGELAEAAADGLIASPEADWPQWRGPRRDGVSGEKGLLPRWPHDGPKLLWKADHVGAGWASPIVVGKRVYLTGDVGDDLVIFSMDMNGRLQWQAKNGKAWKGSFPGSRSCCACSEGRLYHLNAHGRVACLSAEDGKELWAADVQERFAAKNITWAWSECLLVDGPRVIVTPASAKALMAALDKKTGEVVWTTEPLDGDRATYSSPLLFRYAGRRLLANCSSAHGFGADADTGKLLWTVPLKNQYGVNVWTPVYGAGCVAFVTAYFDGGCYRLRSDAGGVRVEKAWTTDLDTVTGGGVLVGGTLYSSGYRKSKTWVGIDWATGQTRIRQRELTTGAAVFADGRLYCLAEDGRVAMLAPSADALEIAGQFRLVAQRVQDAWAHPVLVDGRLYLRYHDTLWCYDVRR